MRFFPCVHRKVAACGSHVIRKAAWGRSTPLYGQRVPVRAAKACMLCVCVCVLECGSKCPTGTLMSADDIVGAVIDQLEAIGALDNTYVWYTR